MASNNLDLFSGEKSEKNREKGKEERGEGEVLTERNVEKLESNFANKR